MGTIKGWNNKIPIIESFITPCISTISGKRKVISGNLWVNIDESVKLKDVLKLHINPLERDIVKVPIIERFVQSSSGSHQYKVIRNSDGKWQCGCPGYVYRGKCRHINEVKNTL